MSRGPEGLTIDVQRPHHVAGREMAGEGVGQAQVGGQLRPIGRGAQNPDRHGLAFARVGDNALIRRCGREPLHQLHDILREGVDVALKRAAQGAGRGLIRARRAAQAQVDAAGMKGVQRAELLGDDQGRVVGQHDAAGADADGLGRRRHRADDDRGRGAGDARHVVVLGQPEALVAEALGVAGQVEGVGQRLRDVGALGHRGEVENGKRDHPSDMGPRIGGAIPFSE